MNRAGRGRLCRRGPRHARAKVPTRADQAGMVELGIDDA